MNPRNEAFTTLKVDQPQPGDDLLSAFRFATWSVWRSGQLSDLSPLFAKQAAGGYDNFLRTQPNPREFFAAHPPRPGEILLSMSRAPVNPGVVITTQRLWLYTNQQYAEFNLADIAQITSIKSTFGASVTILLKDNTKHECAELPIKPNDQFVARACELCGKFQDLNLGPVPTPSQLEAGRQDQTGAGANPGRPYVIFVLIGVVLGSIAGAFVLNGSMIGSFAFLGGLLGYIAWQLKSLIDRSG